MGHFDRTDRGARQGPIDSSPRCGSTDDFAALFEASIKAKLFEGQTLERTIVAVTAGWNHQKALSDISTWLTAE
jgi:hypothetical protein